MKLEKDLQAQILDHLAHKRVFCWRSNTGAMKKGKHFVRFGVKGVPDILGCYKGRMLGIECKADFKEQSQAQHQFQVDLEAAGGLYILCYSLEDVLKVIR